MYGMVRCISERKKFSSYNPINPIRPGGGQYCPPNLFKALKQKPFESLIYNSLTIPKYVYILQTKTIVICSLTGVLGGVSNLPVKKFCAYFGHIYIFFKPQHITGISRAN